MRWRGVLRDVTAAERGDHSAVDRSGRGRAVRAGVPKGSVRKAPSCRSSCRSGRGQPHPDWAGMGVGWGEG